MNDAVSKGVNLITRAIPTAFVVSIVTHGKIHKKTKVETGLSGFHLRVLSHSHRLRNGLAGCLNSV